MSRCRFIACEAGDRPQQILSPSGYNVDPQDSFRSSAGPARRTRRLRIGEVIHSSPRGNRLSRPPAALNDMGRIRYFRGDGHRAAANLAARCIYAGRLKSTLNSYAPPAYR
jgi:hypothetical protein